METVVDVWPGINVNGNFMGTMQTEEVPVLDGYRVVGVRLYQGELIFVWIKRWRYGVMEIFICHVTNIMATTSENVLCFHRW